MSATIAATMLAFPVTAALALAVFVYRRAADRWKAKDQDDAAEYGDQQSR